MSEFVMLPGAQAVHRQESRRAGRFDGGHCCASCTGTSIRRTTTKRCRSRPASPRRRRNASAGSSPRTTTIAIRTMLPDLDALQKNVDMTKELGFANASFDVKAYSDLSMVQEAASALKITPRCTLWRRWPGIAGRDRRRFVRLCPGHPTPSWRKRMQHYENLRCAALLRLARSVPSPQPKRSR